MNAFFESILSELPADASAREIEIAASDLESMNYEPMLLLAAPGFLRMTKKALGEEFERVLSLPEGEASDAIKSKHVGLLVYHYESLCRLRRREPAAWDAINELYEDD